MGWMRVIGQQNKGGKAKTPLPQPSLFRVKNLNNSIMGIKNKLFKDDAKWWFIWTICFYVHKKIRVDKKLLTLIVYLRKWFLKWFLLLTHEHYAKLRGNYVLFFILTNLIWNCGLYININFIILFYVNLL